MITDLFLQAKKKKIYLKYIFAMCFRMADSQNQENYGKNQGEKSTFEIVYIETDNKWI